MTAELRSIIVLSIFCLLFVLILYLIWFDRTSPINANTIVTRIKLSLRPSRSVWISDKRMIMTGDYVSPIVKQRISHRLHVGLVLYGIDYSSPWEH